MNRRIISVITIFASVIFILLSASCGKKALKDDYGCFVNYEDTLDYADKAKKPILLFFTSQGDNEESTQLVTDVLKSEEFSSQVLKNYAVCHADFSQSAFAKMNAQDETDSKQQELANIYTTVMQNNYQLAMLFNVNEMPAVFLCTKEGFVVTRIPDENGINSMLTFTTALDSCNEKLDTFNKLIAQTYKGSASDRVEAIDALYLATEPEYRTFLLPLLKLVPELDKDNKTGLCGKYIVAAAEAQALTLYSQGDVETAIQQYLEAANNSFVKPEGKQECFYTAAYLVAYSGSDDYQGIITYLQTAYDLAPDSSKAPAIKDAIAYFQTIIDNLDEYNSQNMVDAK